MCEFPCIRILSVDCACEQAARESQPRPNEGASCRLSFSQFFLMGKGPKSSRATAQKDNQNASKQRSMQLSESESEEPQLPSRAQSGATTSALHPSSAKRKRVPSRYQSRGDEVKAMRMNRSRAIEDAVGPSVSLLVYSYPFLNDIIIPLRFRLREVTRMRTTLCLNDSGVRSSWLCWICT